MFEDDDFPLLKYFKFAVLIHFDIIKLTPTQKMQMQQFLVRFPTTTLPPSLHMRLLTSFSPDGHTDRDQLKIENGSKRKRLCDADQK